MIFIDACFREKTPYTPIWLMRQAGRYLTEYKQIRAKARDFLSLCQDVHLSSEVTLQPIDILDVDAAILFSDILILPYKMGLDLEFRENVEPRFIQTIDTLDSVQALKRGYDKLDFVYDTVSNVRNKLDKTKALIGFSGAPWTLATYMIEGGGTKSYEKTKRILYTNPNVLHALLEVLSGEIKHYLSMQIKAGVNAIMLFDSWANALEYSKYIEFSWKYILDIVDCLKKDFKHIPLIVFPRGVGAFLEKLNGNFEVLSIDWQIPISEAKSKVGGRFVLQGNLEPARLYDYAQMKEGVIAILEVMKNQGHIFNLGHGMIKDLPRENAIELIKLVRTISSQY